jgi:hypothetical protein
VFGHHWLPLVILQARNHFWLRINWGKLLLVLVSTVILGSESHWIHDMDRTENTVSTNSSIVAYVFVAETRDLVPGETCLESLCLAMAVSSGSTNLALSGHVTIFIIC